ncbi:MAG: class I SAM-dependent rRNA methyltransferase [Anaerolineae bacterium]
MGEVFLKPGREKSVIRGHPWLFSGAIARAEGNPADGEAVKVLDAEGHFLAWGDFNSLSQIAVRLISWEEEKALDRRFWQERMEKALARRSHLAENTSTTAYRLVNAESDLLPGLIVDRYGDWLAIQFLTAGMERRKEEILDILEESCSPRGIYERDDVDVREKEGLPLRAGRLRGEEPPDEVEIYENSLRFLVDIKEGQKTGFYLDQRENRRRCAPYFRGAEVLNGFAYTGAFGVYAAAAGAQRVVNVDSSAGALALARRNLAPFPECESEHLEGDMFQVLRSYLDEGRSFDCIILDPPKFAYSQANVPSACRGYKDINRLALSLLRPGGTLITFSCSGLVSAELFQKVVFAASVDANRPAQILERLSQSPDHPVLLSFPEGEYLKGLICRVL